MKFYRLSDATFYDHINTIYQFIKPFLDKKCLFLRNMEPLITKPDKPKMEIGIFQYIVCGVFIQSTMG